MTGDQTVLLAVGGLTLVCLALLVVVVRVSAGSRRTAAELASLRQRLDDLEGGRRHSSAVASVTSVAAPVEFVITDLGQERAPVEPARLDGPAFADVVLKETVVKAASFAQGVRRGLAPATRNRIRFEMRHEVKRARKQRRADLKTAQRDLHSRQRAALRVDPGEAS